MRHRYGAFGKLSVGAIEPHFILFDSPAPAMECAHFETNAGVQMIQKPATNVYVSGICVWVCLCVWVCGLSAAAAPNLKPTKNVIYITYGKHRNYIIVRQTHFTQRPSAPLFSNIRSGATKQNNEPTIWYLFTNILGILLCQPPHYAARARIA